MNAINYAISKIANIRKNPLYLSLKVGDVVYTKHNGCIKQAKITEIESRIFLGGMVTTIHSDTKFKAILPTGEVISREYDAPYRESYHLYPTPDHARVDKPYHIDIDSTLDESNLILGAIAQECNEVKGSWEGRFLFYKSGADPTQIGYHYLLYRHDESVPVFESKCDKFPNGTIDELEEHGIFTTYKAAYKAFRPKVVCFPTEEPKAVKTQKKRLTIEIEFECDDEEILSEIVDLTDAYHATIAIEKI